MIQDDISYYAMHTNFDAAPGCMADLAAKKLGLTDCEVLEKMGVGTLPTEPKAARSLSWSTQSALNHDSLLMFQG